MENDIKEYLNQFKTETLELIVRIKWCWKKGGPRFDEIENCYNHGWSTRWNIVSIQEMAKRIQKNWDKDCDGGKYFNKIVISHNKYVTRERINNDLCKK